MSARFARGLLLLLTVPCAVATTPEHASGQGWELFPTRTYHPPLVAGIREPHVSALALGMADRMAFQVKDDDPRRVWVIDLGTEIPIFVWEEEASNRGRVAPGDLGVGLWIPIDFHMIEDFVDNSSPIVNTDYRFGATFKLQYGVESEKWFNVRLAFGHESTHLGDEFSIAGQRNFPTTFERINVSWEFVDLSALYEWNSGLIPGEPITGFRAGLTGRLRPWGGSYYSVDAESATESALGPVVVSQNSIDPYLGVDLEWEELLGAWSVYASGELRHRSVYDYHRASADDSEERQASVNVIVGVKKGAAGGAMGLASPFVRFYSGVNPHGQFRNQKGFTVVGVGLRLTR